MPVYTDIEQLRIDTVNQLFEGPAEFDRLAIFDRDAVWWNGLPQIGNPPGSTVLADGDYVVRQHTQRSTTLMGRDYCNVYCFVIRFNDDNRITYVTEHWNTWYAHKFLLENWQLEPAHPNG